MNAKVKVVFWLSDEYRKAALVDRGEQIDQKQTVEFDLADATLPERMAIVAMTGVSTGIPLEINSWSNLSWDERNPTSDHLYLDYIPTLMDVGGHCIRMAMEIKEAQAVHDNALRAKIEQDVAETTSQIRECIANRTLANVDLSSYQKADRERLDIDTSEYDALRVQYDAMADALRIEIENKRVANIVSQKLEQERKAAEKIGWANVNGSAHLVRALEAGHNCQRLYLKERAAIEFPGFVVDFEEAAEWKSRSCPSIEALDVRDIVIASNNLSEEDVEIVWLTVAPSDEKVTRDEYYDSDEFEACEAVVYREDASAYGKYWLVKVM